VKTSVSNAHFSFALVQHLKLSLDDPTNRVRFVRSEDFRRHALFISTAEKYSLLKAGEMMV
jgi:hypothetical protein